MQNAEMVITQLQLDGDTIDEIRNAVNAGNEVTVSKSFINYYGWIGCGYIVYNPWTGEGAYMIFGGDNGGKVMLVISGVFLIYAMLAAMHCSILNIGMCLTAAAFAQAAIYLHVTAGCWLSSSGAYDKPENKGLEKFMEYSGKVVDTLAESVIYTAARKTGFSKKATGMLITANATTAFGVSKRCGL